MKPRLRAARGKHQLAGQRRQKGVELAGPGAEPVTYYYMDGSAAIPEAADGSGKGTALVKMKIWRQE